MNPPILASGISVVVPVYNSQATLPLLVARLEPVLATAAPVFELILVNDGSRDQSWEVVQTLVRQHAWVRGVCMMRNYGQHNALLCGIRAARYDKIVTLDDDLQTPPEEIPKLLAKLNEGFDVVYGTPEEEQHGLARDVCSRLAKLVMQSVMGVENATRGSAYRILRTDLREAFTEYQNPFVVIDVLLSYGTKRFGAVAVKHDPRRIGQSNYNYWKLFKHLLNMFTSFSALPLQLASVLGFFMTLIGTVLLAYVLIGYLIHGSAVAGFPFLASIIAIFSGTQMFALGIIGEYLARIHIRSMGRPVYTVKQIVEQQSGGVQP